MFLLKIFGIMDLYSAVVMMLVQFHIIEWRMILTASAYLILKGYLFRGELASMIDLGIGAYHMLMFVLPIPTVTYVLSAYLVVKGLMSMM